MRILKVGLFYLCLSIINKTKCKEIKEKLNLRKKFIATEEFIPRAAEILKEIKKAK